MSTSPTVQHRDLIKARGAHYTPPALARFLARAMVRELPSSSGPIRVLDPACGDGSLLLALAEVLSPSVRKRLCLVGLDTHEQAVEEARVALAHLDVASIDLRVGDFLRDGTAGSRQSVLSWHAVSDVPSRMEGFHAVIANPPYVRTQVLGAKKAQDLARRYDLSGRVDLYHAFLKAMAIALRDGGVLGLLTSNRFLVTQAGAAMRRALCSDFDLRCVIDLGDTKLFSAAVLPAIVIAHRGPAASSRAPFVRVYELRERDGAPFGAKVCSSILDALTEGQEGLVQVDRTYFRIERGVLDAPDASQPWTPSSDATVSWSQAVGARTVCVFGDVAKIRVGIKTTADSVFIRDDWAALPPEVQPEEELLRPLLTHHVATPWRATTGVFSPRVLYPHTIRTGQRVPVDLDEFPRARAYLETHRERLSARRYVIEAGRRWYELWVPQHPTEWSCPKIVFPDISEAPRFFLEDEGAVVNGDCYWITLQPGKAGVWLPLMLAVANSNFVVKYYDARFNNKLYSGRRRFLTQYVEKFPLPDPDSPDAKEVVALVERRLLLTEGSSAPMARELEVRIDSLVWRLFGLVEEAGR